MSTAQKPYIRKSVYALDNEEKTRLRDAFQMLYEAPLAHNQSNGMRYQQLAGILNTDGHYEWNDLLFLPWARTYFWWFEQALRAVAPEVTLPYWDYTSATAQENGLPELFTDSSYVNGQGDTVPNPLLMAEYKYPLRTFRAVQADQDLLQKAAQLLPVANGASSFVDFSLSVYPVDVCSHLYLGGSSANPDSTSYDPVFWFTHCQLDHMWWQWQQAHDNYTAPPSVLQTDMTPFVHKVDGTEVLLKGKDVMHTFDLGYVYE